MNRKDFKNKSEMQIFLSYFKPHRKLFFLDMACALGIVKIRVTQLLNMLK